MRASLYKNAIGNTCSHVCYQSEKENGGEVSKGSVTGELRNPENGKEDGLENVLPGKSLLDK